MDVSGHGNTFKFFCWSIFVMVTLYKNFSRQTKTNFQKYCHVAVILKKIVPQKIQSTLYYTKKWHMMEIWRVNVLLYTQWKYIFFWGKQKSYGGSGFFVYYQWGVLGSRFFFFNWIKKKKFYYFLFTNFFLAITLWISWSKLHFKHNLMTCLLLLLCIQIWWWCSKKLSRNKKKSGMDQIHSLNSGFLNEKKITTYLHALDFFFAYFLCVHIFFVFWFDSKICVVRQKNIMT